jgi:primosomal protein N' (replication factor Y)
MLPAGVWLKTKYMCRLSRPDDKEAAYRAAEGDMAAAAVLDELYAAGGRAAFNELLEAVGEKAQPAISRLEEAGVIVRELEGKRRASDKSAANAVLEVSSEDALLAAELKRRSSPQQSELLRLLASLGHASVKERLYFTGASMKSVKALEKAGYISLCHVEEYRSRI